LFSRRFEFGPNNWMAAPSVLLTRDLREVKPAAVFNRGAVQWVERVAAGIAFAAAAPTLGATMLAVRALSGRSPLIAHRRVGLKGRPFWILKLRTMWDKSLPQSGSTWIEYLSDTDVPVIKGAPDPRVTSRLAAFCRRYSVDELPQLLQVVTGRLALVGPRPLTSAELEAYYGEDCAEVLSVRPGLTGLWQVMGRNRLTYAQRRRLDLFFLRKCGLGLYLRILLRTPARVFSGRDAW
jgi:lipopolysaccharide/colanic/teichoic acid biosynthesis glycosyltransferase